MQVKLLVDVVVTAKNGRQTSIGDSGVGTYRERRYFQKSRFAKLYAIWKTQKVLMLIPRASMVCCAFFLRMLTEPILLLITHTKSTESKDNILGFIYTTWTRSKEAIICNIEEAFVCEGFKTS